MRVLILGATGSIGQQCCEVCLQRHDKIVGISFFNNYVSANKIQTKYKFSPKHKKHSNVRSYQELIQKSRPDIIVLAISNLETATRILKMIVDAKINVILANKEALILNAKEYQYWLPRWNKQGTAIIPLDSEHSALLQIISQNYASHGGLEQISWYAISASGGRFINLETNDLKKVKYDQVLNHPVWNMGKEITVNSATMFNKFTEMLEAFFIMQGITPRVFVDKKANQHAIVCYKNGDCFVYEHKPTMTTHINDCLNFFAKKNNSVQKMKYQNIQWITNAQFIQLFNKYHKLIYSNSFSQNMLSLFTKNTALANQFINKKISFYTLMKQIYK